MADEPPPDAKLALDRARALMWARRVPEAAAAFGSIAEQYPYLMEAHANRAVALRELGKFADAAAGFERAVSLGPVTRELARDWLLTLSEVVGGEAALLRVVAEADRLGLSEVARQELRGAILARSGRFVEAIEAYDRAIAHEPQWPMARYGRGLAALTLGEFSTGWTDYEYRWDVLRRTASKAPSEVLDRLARWPDAETFAGRKVALVTEQGIGDILMFASAVQEVIALAAEVSIDASPRLARLLSHSFPGLAVGPAAADAVPVALGSLPHAFRRDIAAFPQRPYLTPSELARIRARDLLGPRDGRRRVGLAWRGGVGVTGMERRSIPLTQFAGILRTPSVEFVSLQHGDVGAEVADLPLRVLPASALEDFDDMAGVVGELDGVLSVQTAIVHLSGALGVPCAVTVPAVPEWRYGARGDTMPWYASVRVHRRSAEDDWLPTIAAAWADLAGRMPLGVRAPRTLR
jgi:tetratricopeptide (TPR) repeat protein